MPGIVPFSVGAGRWSVGDSLPPELLYSAVEPHLTHDWQRLSQLRQRGNLSKGRAFAGVRAGIDMGLLDRRGGRGDFMEYRKKVYGKI